MTRLRVINQLNVLYHFRNCRMTIFRQTSLILFVSVQALPNVGRGYSFELPHLKLSRVCD